LDAPAGRQVDKSFGQGEVRGHIIREKAFHQVKYLGEEFVISLNQQHWPGEFSCIARWWITNS
jgi:hypothetical protein